MWVQEFGLELNWISPVGRTTALSEGWSISSVHLNMEYLLHLHEYSGMFMSSYMHLYIIRIDFITDLQKHLHILASEFGIKKNTPKKPVSSPPRVNMDYMS